MKYLLDSNAVISLLKDSRTSLAQRVRLCRPQEVAISSIVAHELYYGAYKSQRQQHNLAVVDKLHFEVLPFDQEDARQAGLVRAQLNLQGTPIGPYDALIAGQALARNLTLVTHNTGEFSRVKGLHWVDWEQP